MNEQVPCALRARELGEQPRGTAPRARTWVCIEQPGPWGPKALLESQLDGELGRQLTEASNDLPLRVQLIRRPGGGASGRRAVFVAHAGPGRVWCRRIDGASDDDVRKLDLAALADGSEPEVGVRHDAPLYLVCTHAKRDACCARWGRPLVAALAAGFGDAVWETSHVGGHRFAGNLVALPEGLVYGSLEPDDAVHLIETHRRGLIDLARFRGRSSLGTWAQAADWFLRDRIAERGIDAVEVVTTVPVGGDHAEVVLEALGRRYRVRLERRPTGEPRLMGCDKEAPEDPGEIVLTGITAA